MPKNIKNPMATSKIGKLPKDDNPASGEHSTKKKFSKKVLYVEIDDELTFIYDRLKQLKIKNIYLVVPKRAILFQSIVNLKILKSKAEDLGKNIYIITNDPNGLHLARQVGLNVYNKLEGHEHPSLVSGKFFEDQQDISPLKASINSLEDDMPTRQTEKKLSISELIRSGHRKSLAFIARNLTRKNTTEQKKPQKQKAKFTLVAPNRQALLSLIVISLIILLTITYIALPGATIELTPKSNILSASNNLVLADAEINRSELETHPERMLDSYNFTTTINKVLNFPTTGTELSGESQNAEGVITVYNETAEDRPLVAKTRFQTKNGLVFRSQKEITVPGQRGGKPGTIDVEVVADPYDALDQVTGERGNIGPSDFFLPGLSEENQKKIYGKSTESMSGGKAMTIKKVSEQDIAAAKDKLKKDLENAAQVELEAKIKEYNKEHNTNLSLLKAEEAIQKGEADIVVPDDIEGKNVDSFEVKGEITVSGTAYNHDEMIYLLRAELNSKKTPGKRLVHIDFDSLSYSVVSIDQASKKITLNATLQGIEEFDIRPEDENGGSLLKKIKDHVVGKEIKEAKDYIQKLPEVEKVSIEPWPFWAPTMPSIADNIHVEIVRPEE